MIDPPPYDASSIHRLRPPEVEGEEGAWVSRWLLRLASDPGESSLREVETRLQVAEGVGVRLLGLEPDLVRLELVTHDHPLDVESYLLIDRVLLEIDESLGGITFINESPRDWWRTFRNRLRRLQTGD
jgi:hypothetical protein